MRICHDDLRDAIKDLPVLNGTLAKPPPKAMLEVVAYICIFIYILQFKVSVNTYTSLKFNDGLENIWLLSQTF